MSQVPEQQIAHLKNAVMHHYNNVNELLLQRTIFSLISSLLKIPPIISCLLVFSVISIIITLFPNGFEWFLLLFGLIIPFFFTWNAQYEYQPLPPTFSTDQPFPHSPTATNNLQSPVPLQEKSTSDSTQPPPIVQLSQPNHPVYLFWAKYWLLYCLTIIFDSTFRSLFTLAISSPTTTTQSIVQTIDGQTVITTSSMSSSLWSSLFSSSTTQTSSTYLYLYHLHLLFLILPPWFYSTFLYDYILEPILLLHFETVFQTYETTKRHLSVVAQDTLSTTTTAFRTISKHALVGGINSLTQQPPTPQSQ